MKMTSLERSAQLQANSTNDRLHGSPSGHLLLGIAWITHARIWAIVLGMVTSWMTTTRHAADPRWNGRQMLCPYHMCVEVGPRRRLWWCWNSICRGSRSVVRNLNCHRGHQLVGGSKRRLEICSAHSQRILRRSQRPPSGLGLVRNHTHTSSGHQQPRSFCTSNL